MNKKESPVLHLAIVSVLATVFPKLTIAAPFCNGKPNIYYGGDSLITGSINASDCYEVGALADGGFDDYVGTAKNLEMLNGSKLSVLGYFEDSVVRGGAEAWISKTPRIAVEGYQKDVPATGSRIDIQSGGLIRVLDGGVLKESVLNGGTVYISDTGTVSDPGKSENNTVNSGGKLYVYRRGLSFNTQVKNGGYEYVQTNGQARNTQVNDGGTQFLQSGGQAFNTQLYGRSTQSVYAGSSTTDTTLHDSARSWLAADAQALGTTSVHQQAQLQLTAGAKDRLAAGAGAYAQSVVLADAGSTMVVITGHGDNYAFTGSLAGQGQVRFVAPAAAATSHLMVDSLSGSQVFYMNTDIAAQQADYLSIKNGSGSHVLNIQDSGAEITQPGSSRLDLVTQEAGSAQFRLGTLAGVNIHAVDGGTYMYALEQRDENARKIWYLAAHKNGTTPTGPDERTTPSTDAILSLSSAPQLIFNNELDNLRFRRGELSANPAAAGGWVRVIGDKTRIDHGNTQFSLRQKGVELGADKAFHLAQGQLWLGVFTGYNNANLQHQRGGESKVDSTTAGAYASYFADTGWYLDAVLKYNHFSNHLSAMSTNLKNVTGNYSQNAYGTALEAGYSFKLPQAFWVEPFARLSYMQAGSQLVRLDNGMQAQLDTQKSLISELGVHLGKNIVLRNQTVVSIYSKLSWQHEYIDSNQVLVNQRNSFYPDFSGDSLKEGLGFSVQFNPQLVMYAELDYRKGRNIESPLHGDIGARYTF